MRNRLILIILGCLSFILYFGITDISTRFNWGEGYEQRPIPTYLILYFSLFLLYALAARLVWEKKPADRATFWIILLGGLLFRAAILPSQPIQEDDVYRYLWDGKVFAHGINPYEYSPREVDDFTALRIRSPQKLRARYNERQIRELTLLNRLKWRTETALVFKERVNHPDVPTIYPPLTQHVFRLVHRIQPDSIVAMRLAFAVFDLATLLAIIQILGALGKNRNLCLIYFWSPLLIKETYNSTHLDVIGISVLCAAICFLIRSRHTLATTFLALGVLGKFYPAILLPLFLKAMFFDRQRAVSHTDSAGPKNPPAAQKARRFPGNVSPRMYVALHVVLFLGVILVFYLPFFHARWETFRGLRAFAIYWQNNDSIFSLLMYFYGNLLGLQSVAESYFQDRVIFWSYDLPTLLSKVTVALILAGVMISFLSRRAGKPSSLAYVRQMFILMTLAFVLSPAQYPWYFNWILPFLCLFPSRALILLTALLGLYYMDFYFSYQNLPRYNPWIPWVEYTPAYLLLILEWRRKPALARGNEG
ncbi:MAG: hypothetical protein ACE5G9_12765 [Nitrospinales bacterium]